MLMERCPIPHCHELMRQGAEDCGMHSQPSKHGGVRHTYPESVIIEFIHRMSCGRTPYDVQRDKGMPTHQNVLNRCKKAPKLQTLYAAAMLICYPDRAVTTCAWEGCKEKRKGKSKYCGCHQEKAWRGHRSSAKRVRNGRLPNEPKPHHEKGPQRNRPMTVEEETRLDREQHKLNLKIDRLSRSVPAHLNYELLAQRLMRGAVVASF